jgi:hypothetical protein
MHHTANDERATSSQCDVTSLDAASFFNSIKSARPFLNETMDWGELKKTQYETREEIEEDPKPHHQ